ncbi:aspartate carbamoyltransferase [Candidatus Saccharibacteria bacterium]|nr:aspartate carbamoyltransferase [Candidatus Saccharibacteria bacterium]
MHHILSSDQFSTKEIEKIFALSDEFKKQLADPGSRKKLTQLYQGRQMATLFYQPSTRTRLSFETAALKLGMGVVSTEDALSFSSAAKGESLEDTIKVINGYYPDIIILRHHETGGAKRAAAVSNVPIINAGDGRSGEHPTQSLLDAYTIKTNYGRLDNLKVVMGGDLLQSRCVRSLVYILSKYKNNHITFVSIPEFQIGNDVKTTLRRTKTSFDQTDNMRKAFAGANVIYWTRLQAEYLKGKKAAVAGGFTIDKSSLKLLQKRAIIMHPLPRVGEISPEIDNDPRAKYFEQAGNGLYIRMALIDQILKNRK